jgi:SUMO ligase MMS21 Smc5/6 complex component
MTYALIHTITIVNLFSTHIFRFTNGSYLITQSCLQIAKWIPHNQVYQMVAKRSIVRQNSLHYKRHYVDVKPTSTWWIDTQVLYAIHISYGTCKITYKQMIGHSFTSREIQVTFWTHVQVSAKLAIKASQMVDHNCNTRLCLVAKYLKKQSTLRL